MLVLNGHRFLDVQNYTFSQAIFLGNSIIESAPDDEKGTDGKRQRRGPVTEKKSYFGDWEWPKKK